MSRPKDTAFVPCGHQVCAECQPQLSACHVCRQPVAQSLKLY